MSDLEQLNNPIAEAYWRALIVKEVTGFASAHAHNIDGRDVVIVEQLLDFLKARK